MQRDGRARTRQLSACHGERPRGTPGLGRLGLLRPVPDAPSRRPGGLAHLLTRGSECLAPNYIALVLKGAVSRKHFREGAGIHVHRDSVVGAACGRGCFGVSPTPTQEKTAASPQRGVAEEVCKHCCCPPWGRGAQAG